MDFSEMTVPVVPGLSRKHIEQKALEFLLMVAPECLDTPIATPVKEIFEDKMDTFGFKAFLKGNIKGLDGITNVTTKEIMLTGATHKRLELGNPRARFTVAHEFGHVILHGHLASTGHSMNGEQVLFARRSQLKAFEDPEWQADTFAGAVLMPYPMMYKLYQEKQMTVENVIEVFQVSKQAAEIRVRKLTMEFFK